MPKVSVIIPAYNEQKYLEKTLRGIDKKYERIVVNDNSKDNTANIAKKYATRVITHKINKGKGQAMRTGAKAAKGNIIVFIDASSFDPKQIPKLIEKMQDSKADMVVGIREFKNIPFARKLSNVVVKLIITLGTFKRIPDPLCGFRAMRRKDFLELQTIESRYPIESEINIKMIKRKAKIEGMSVKVYYKGVPSSYSLRQSVITFAYMVKQLVKLRFGF